MATTLAGFPPDVREEVLMTADESVLSQLPPALLAEAQVEICGTQKYYELTAHIWKVKRRCSEVWRNGVRLSHCPWCIDIA